MHARPDRIFALTILLVMLAAALYGLTTQRPGSDEPPSRAHSVRSATTERSALEPGQDLSQIRFRREFRILIPPRGPRPATGPSARSPREVELLEKFADEQFLIPKWIAVRRHADLVPTLLAGGGDLIGAGVAIAELRHRGVEHTVPVETVQERLVVRAGDRIESLQDLGGREIAIAERSSFWPELRRLVDAVPGLRVRILPALSSPESVLQRVLDLELDMAVVRVHNGRLAGQRWRSLRRVDAFSASTSLSFGVHPDAVELRTALDDFLTREQLARREVVRHHEDLDGIRERGVLRVLTRNNAASYFIWRGKPLGFEYELLGKFADEHDLTLEMVVPPRRDQLVPRLLDGEGDMIAAAMAVTDERRARGLAFTRPYKESEEVVVARRDGVAPASARDLAGRTLYVRRSSPVWDRLQALRASGIALQLRAAPEALEDEELVDRVANGVYDLTVANAHTVKVALSWRDDVTAAFELNGPVPIAWAVRKESPQLLAALDAFIEREYRGEFYNVVRARYFENARRIRSHVEQRADRHAGGRLSPYDEIVQRYAEEYGFDWPLIVAVMYRESRFEPKVVSWAGARGLMQVLPVTAKRFGITDLLDPESSIAAGVKMLNWLYGRMESTLSVKDRTWFSLAAYNAGLGHLLDARRLAEELGLDPDRWFDNVERAMLLLSKPQYYRKSKHGYVRGIEPVVYVRDIRNLYNAYRSLLPS